MTFDRPLALLLLLLPVVWLAWEWPSATRRASLPLKSAALAAVVLALAQPRFAVYQTKVALAFLADTSASVSPRDLAAESALAGRLEKARGRNWWRITPFARSTRDPAPEERAKNGWNLRYTPGDAGRGTDLESAIRDGAASLPAGAIQRLLLASDGNENQGSVARAIWQARQLGIPVDTVPLTGRDRPGLALSGVTIPGQVFSGERFPIELSLESPRQASASVEVTAEGKVIGSSDVQLEPGSNRLTVQASINSVGAVALSGKIAAGGLGEARFDDAITLRRPRVRFVSRDPAAGGQHLVRALEANQFEVARSPGGVPENLQDDQIVIIDNWNEQSIPPARQAALEQFVKQGGGLLWLGGEHNVFVSKSGPEDPLERTLPAKLVPPRNPEGAAVVLVIDKSSSMEGQKMNLARLAAIGVVDNLRPIDSVGVLIFDNSFQWAVPIRPASDRSDIARLISGIVADGGTQIAPALAEAYQRILRLDAAYKHIVLMTDGISEEGDSLELAQRALRNRVTISTVGLGQDVNRGYLERLASIADGKSYLLNDPSGLERILLRDVEEHSGSTAVERPVRPRVVKQAAILDGVDIEHAPPLRGYIRYESRPAADTILEAGHGDPLLARWQYGLGRAAVFTSDAKNRWAVDWVSWPGFDRFWANVLRDLLPHAPAAETTAAYDRASGDLVVDYQLARAIEEEAVGQSSLTVPGRPGGLPHAEPPAAPGAPDIYVFGPDGFAAPLRVSKVANGHYRGRVAIGARQGLFRVRPVADSRAFPETGFYRQEDELREYGNNEPLLRQIAAATGGRFNPTPREVFDSRGRGIRSSMELWPGLLALAILLNLAELILRKWKGILEAARLRPARETA